MPQNVSGTGPSKSLLVLTGNNTPGSGKAYWQLPFGSAEEGMKEDKEHRGPK